MNDYLKTRFCPDEVRDVILIRPELPSLITLVPPRNANDYTVSLKLVKELSDGGPMVLQVGVASIDSQGRWTRTTMLWTGAIDDSVTEISFKLQESTTGTESPGATTTWLFAQISLGSGSLSVAASDVRVIPTCLDEVTGQDISASNVLIEFSDRTGAAFAHVLRDGDYRFADKRLGGLFSLVDVNDNQKRPSIPRFARMRDDFCSILTNLRSWKSSNAIAPVPRGQAAEAWELLDVEAFLDTQIPYDDVVACSLDSPYAQNAQVVHPYIAQFYGRFLGYETIMMLTDYHDTNDKYEDPSLYGIEGLRPRLLREPPQPLATPNTSFGNNYNSDPFMFYDFHGGVLVFCWRNGSKAKGFQLMARETVDGIHWSEPTRLLPIDRKSLMLSPCVLYAPDKDKYAVYAVIKNQKGELKLSFCWMSPDRRCTEWQSIDAPFPIWHIEIKRAGTGFLGVFNDCYNSRQLFLGFSNDGFNWRFAKKPLLSGKFESSYKASIGMSIQTENDWQCRATLKLDVYWTTSNRGGLRKSDQWRLRYAQFSTPVVGV